MFSAKSRITIGLACLLVTVLCTAALVGLIPEHNATLRAERGTLCEPIAVCASDYVSHGEMNRLEHFLQVVASRNHDIVSAGVRQANGRLLADVNHHVDIWTSDGEEHSTETHVQVPIRAGTQKWGNVEIVFRPVV